MHYYIPANIKIASSYCRLSFFYYDYTWKQQKRYDCFIRVDCVAEAKNFHEQPNYCLHSHSLYIYIYILKIRYAVFYIFYLCTTWKLRLKSLLLIVRVKLVALEGFVGRFELLLSKQFALQRQIAKLVFTFCILSQPKAIFLLDC